MSTRKKDDAVQDEILQAALRLYKKYGPGKVTMDEVATATGRSRTSLYYYYKNHDEIFQAVLDAIANDVARELRDKVATADTLSDKIYAFCIAKIRSSAEWKKIFIANWEVMDSEEKSKHTMGVSILHKKLLHQEGIVLKEIFSQGIASGQMRAVSAAEQDMLAFMISSNIRGLRNEIYEQNDPHDMKAALQLLTDMVVKWLQG